MSRSWRGGSTRAWRRLRLFVLERDGWACQVPVDPPRQLATSDGSQAGGPPRGPVLSVGVLERSVIGHNGLVICGAYADTAGHIVAKIDGGLDTADNLRAECRRHNYGAGAETTQRNRRKGWSW